MGFTTVEASRVDLRTRKAPGKRLRYDRTCTLEIEEKELVLGLLPLECGRSSSFPARGDSGDATQGWR